MTTTTPAPDSNPNQRTVHEPDAIAVWTMGIDAESDPRLLSRILQKLAVPEIELIGVNFAQGEKISFARVHLRCTGAWAHLTAGKLRKLVNVLSVALRPLSSLVPVGRRTVFSGPTCRPCTATQLPAYRASDNHHVLIERTAATR